MSGGYITPKMKYKILSKKIFHLYGKKARRLKYKIEIYTDDERLLQWYFDYMDFTAILLPLDGSKILATGYFDSLSILSILRRFKILKHDLKKLK